jgi:hypothetical protein
MHKVRFGSAARLLRSKFEKQAKRFKKMKGDKDHEIKAFIFTSRCRSYVLSRRPRDGG